MITVLYGITYGIPILILALFISAIFKRTKHLKPTENLLSFLFIFAFFIIVPFLIYLAGIFHAGKGFIGFYLSLSGVLREFYLKDKIVFVFFSFYLASIHTLGLLPFLAILQFVSARNKLYRATSGVHTEKTEINKKELDELENLIQTVKTNIGIKENVNIKILEGRKAHKIIGSSNCAVIKYRDSIYLLFGRNFLELFSKGTISKDEVRAILLHEFSHILNRDYLVPVASKVILNRRFSLVMYFSFSVLLATIGRYPFLFGPGALHQAPFYSLPYPLVLLLAFSAVFGLLGVGLSFMAMSLQRCEVLADYLAVQYVFPKVLKGAIIKMSIISEAGNSVALNFSSKSEPISTKRKHNFLCSFLGALKTLDFFSKNNKLFHHPSLSQRIKALDNPSIIIEEEAKGLLSLELFGVIGVSAMIAIGFMLILLNSFIPNINLRDVNWFAFSYAMYFWLVLLACLPLRYAKNPFVFSKRNVKLIAVYGLFVTIFSNFVPLVMWWKFILEKMDRSEDWIVRMFIKTQISNSIDRLVHGFIFSLVLFAIFLSVGNFIVRRKRIGVT